MEFLDTLKKWIAQVVEIVVVLIPLAIVLQILFGTATQFFSGVVGNLLDLVKQFGNAGLVGLIALGIIVWLFGYVGQSSKSSGGGSY